MDRWGGIGNSTQRFTGCSGSAVQRDGEGGGRAAGEAPGVGAKARGGRPVESRQP